MQKIIRYFFMVSVAGLIITGCGKKGNPGPQGVKGDTGATGSAGLTGAGGPQGATGTAGANGATGATGAIGSAGATGATGTNGSNGTNGIDGATGATGSTGATGNTGAQGQQGEKGDPGAANVNSFLFESRSVSLTGYTQFSIPAITQDIVDKGLVIGFIRTTGSGNSWFALPFQEDDRRSNIAYYSVGNVYVKSNYNSAGLDFRFVVVPGNSVTKLNTVNRNNYMAVKSALNFRD